VSAAIFALPSRQAGGRPPSCPPQVCAYVIDLQRQGLSLRKISHVLNAEGIPTPAGRKTWTKSTVDRLLHTRHARELMSGQQRELWLSSDASSRATSAHAQFRKFAGNERLSVKTAPTPGSALGTPAGARRAHLQRAAGIKAARTARAWVQARDLCSPSGRCPAHGFRITGTAPEV